jgi:hypothetical protein
MKLASKIAASIALLGALTVSRAESITFGVNIPPVASLIVRDGILKDPASMYTAGGAITPIAGAVTVGGFTVITNMPKWNIYFSFANGGTLKNQTGAQIKDDKGVSMFLGGTGLVPALATTASVWLSSADNINATDDAATKATPVVPALAIATAPIVNPLASNNTLTGAIQSAGAAMCNNGAASACSFTAPWLNATDLTAATFDISTGLTSAAGTKVANVAGTYTETMYLTLVTSY